jgi:cell division protein FtsQ
MENQSDNTSVSRYYSKKKRRKKRRKLMFYTLLTVFMVVVITVLSLTVFFNITTFEVEGNVRYGSEEIIAASGLQTGQNMFRLNKFEIIENLKKQLPYLSEVSMRRDLPSTIRITVAESQPFACVYTGGSYYIVDENLKVLEISALPPDGIPEIKGFAAQSAETGSILTSDDGADQTVLKLTQSIKQNFGIENVSEITVQSLHELGFVYDGRVKVMLGGIDRIDQKLRLVRHVIDDNQSKEHAEIDVSSGVRAYYRSVEAEDENEQSEENGKENEENDEQPEENDEETVN